MDFIFFKYGVKFSVEKNLVWSSLHLYSRYMYKLKDVQRVSCIFSKLEQVYKIQVPPYPLVDLGVATAGRIGRPETRPRVELEPTLPSPV